MYFKTIIDKESDKSDDYIMVKALFSFVEISQT